MPSAHFQPGRASRRDIRGLTHNPEVAGSNPAHATIYAGQRPLPVPGGAFLLCVLTSLLTALRPSGFPDLFTVPPGFLTNGTRLAGCVGIRAGAAVACRVPCRCGRLAREQLVSPRCCVAARRWAQERLSPETHAGVLSARIRDFPEQPREPYSIYSSCADEGLEQWTHDPLFQVRDRYHRTRRSRRRCWRRAQGWAPGRSSLVISTRAE
jgi:hypothetical protein